MSERKGFVIGLVQVSQFINIEVNIDMNKKMSLVGISFAILGLAFMCESANAATTVNCFSGSKPSSVSSNYGLVAASNGSNVCSGDGCSITYSLANRSYCRNIINSGTAYWFCKSSYVQKKNSGDCVAITNGQPNYDSGGNFTCNSDCYYDGSGCSKLPSQSNTVANNRDSSNNTTGWSCAIGHTMNAARTNCP
jgi:hypothetical protein